MPRSNNADFIKEKNKEVNQPVFLYTIYNYNGLLTNLYFTNASTNIVFNGDVYIRFPISHDAVSENTQNQIDAVKVTISNILRVIEKYLNENEFRGKKVSIKQIWGDKTNDTDNYVEDIYYIDYYTTAQDDVVFTCTSKLDILSVQLPGRKYFRNTCAWKFKSIQCGYPGGTATCNKTLQTCRALGNSQRYGGFPSIPQKRVSIG
jgi:lambda family phage minor tail protein L